MDTPDERFAALRILDANRNRATEGLRVVEEFARFRLHSRYLAESCKRLRHLITDTISQSGIEHSLIPSRDTLNDVGTNIGTKAEYQRGSMVDVARAGFQRVEQALRILEEYGKLIEPALGQRFEQIRYETYTIEKAFITNVNSQARLEGCLLYVLVEGGDDQTSFARLIEQLIDSRVHLIQLRDKQLSDRELLKRGEQLKRLVDGTDVLFVFNDRPDLAQLVGADGVHVGQSELPVAAARRVVGSDKLIGVSTHSLEQAKKAVLDGADYIGVGPVFRSKTKSFDRYVGVELLEQVSGQISLPAFGIGGIDLSNVSTVTAAGMRRIAVGNAITHASDISAAVTRFLTALETDEAPVNQEGESVGCNQLPSVEDGKP